jgi:two-component system chemotaxis response regulator CheB
MKKKVLIVDDSALMRKFLKLAIEQSSQLQVIGMAADAFQAREILLTEKPDLMTLDLEMPKLDGMSFLEKVMEHFPTKTVIISGFAKEGSQLALKALSLGAIDVIEKPDFETLKDPDFVNSKFLQKIEAACSARISKARSVRTEQFQLGNSDSVLAVAASTGGTEAIKVFLAGLKPPLPPTVIVQHMPAGFTKIFAENLAKIFPFKIMEAKAGDKLSENTILIAPGNFHMELKKVGSLLSVQMNTDPQIHGVRPAADVLFKSVAKAVGAKAIGVVLTGMGKDGAEGLLEIKKSGGLTFAQSEATCTVFGMPAACIKLDAAQYIVDLAEMPRKIHSVFGKIKVAS